MIIARRSVLAILVVCALVFAFLKLSSLHEERNKNSVILTAITFGTEAANNKVFINKLTRGTELDQISNIRIFLGPYLLLLGNEGILMQTHLNYYVFIDMNFYNSLDRDEKEALIAHEIGHAVYKTSFIDETQLRILNTLGIFNKYHSRIVTKYQIKADRFSAEKTSPAAVISLLDKLYLTDKYYPDYIMRMESLKKLKQAR